MFSCTDEINTEYDEVVIHGTLCQSHRYTLTHIIQDTLIILKDNICEDIPNCQQVTFVIFLSFSFFKVLNFLTV